MQIKGKIRGFSQILKILDLFFGHIDQK